MTTQDQVSSLADLFESTWKSSKIEQWDFAVGYSKNSSAQINETQPHKLVTYSPTQLQ